MRVRKKIRALNQKMESRIYIKEYGENSAYHGLDVLSLEANTCCVSYITSGYKYNSNDNYCTRHHYASPLSIPEYAEELRDQCYGL